jgi:hypothetical protein
MACIAILDTAVHKKELAMKSLHEMSLVSLYPSIICFFTYNRAPRNPLPSFI